MNPETVIKENLLYQGKALRFYVQETQLPDGHTIRRSIARSPGAVVIVPITDRQEVRMIKQYRAAAEKWVIELPAGTLAPGERPQEAAPRELLEETGDRAASWQALPGFYTAPGFLDEFLYLFLAMDLTPGPNHLEADEHIEVLTIPWTEAIRMVRRGEVEDAKTISGLFQAGLHLNLPLI